MLNYNDYEKLIELAIAEDINGKYDVTTEAIFTTELANAELISKDSGILAGSLIFESVFKKIDKNVKVEFNNKDGDLLKYGDCVSKVSGNAISILKGERIALNFISFLSGISSKTHKYVKKALESGKSIILDTRKTLPGFRNISKYAVSVGGGKNHRMGLYDMVMIKDNHIDVAGSITKAVELVRLKWANQYIIEVECRTIDDVKEAIKNQVDIIMLDNMNKQVIMECMKLSTKEIKFEASGGIDLNKIKEVSETGVDYISIGALTHSVKAFDFSLKIKYEK